MPDLIAQGPEPQHRWRRKTPVETPFFLGRSAGSFSTPWDDRISRRHVELRFREGRLIAKVLPEALNPVFYRGRRETEFEVRPGEHFVIGATTFTLSTEQALASLNLPAPVTERTFTPQELARHAYRHADQRIEALSRLPDILANSASDSELFVRLVNLLLTGVRPATAAALVSVEGQGRVEVLHWDRRLLSGAEFQPSERLIRQAVEGGVSVAHAWSPATQKSDDFTVSEGIDWACCVPVPGAACRGWGLYVTGRFAEDDSLTDTEALRDDVKFIELAAATLGSLREAQHLGRRQTSLRQFFSPVVLDALAGQDPEVVLAPREADVTVLFCDLRGFARQSERLAGNLRELLERVSRALGVMTRHILQQGGVVGDFHGDAAMGFWGWPLPQADAVERACRAALAIRAEFTGGGSETALPDFRVGIGLASGRAVAGKIGTVDQVKVTVFGPVVNLASRLEGLTKVLRAPILIDPATAEVLRTTVGRQTARVRRVARVKPPGLEGAVEATELLPPAGEFPQLGDEHLAAYEAALDALLARDWERAFQLLHQVPATDQVKDFLTVFIAQHHRQPPENWDGVIPVPGK